MFYNRVSSYGQILTYCYDLVHVNCGFLSKIIIVSEYFSCSWAVYNIYIVKTIYLHPTDGVGVCGTKL